MVFSIPFYNFYCFLTLFINSSMSSTLFIISLDKLITPFSVTNISSSILIPIPSSSIYIPGSSLVSIFGALFISLFYAEGVNPVLVAAMLPCFCGVMCGITPPLALGMYAGMSIAESDPGKTIKNDLWWVAGQYILEVIVLLGWLPIIGL